MQTIALGLNSVPGVMGCLLSDTQGNVLAHTFPPLFDQGDIKNLAVLITDNSMGLKEVTGEVRQFDMRFDLGRIIIKSIPRFFVTVLCEPTINVQLLSITLNVIIKKLEKIPDDQIAAFASQSSAVPAPEAVAEKAPAATEAAKKSWLERMQNKF